MQLAERELVATIGEWLAPLRMSACAEHFAENHNDASHRQFPRNAMTRHIVCLTSDFDAHSGFIARGLTTPTPLSRGEFGAVRRVASSRC